jgi:HPt (histidine-containing phosphotransfer) domain-containing protein
MALYRAQILLDESHHAGLERLARESGRSMSELVRDMLDDYLARASEEEATCRALAAIDELGGLRQSVERQHGTLAVSLLDELREERDAEVNSVGGGATERVAPSEVSQ